jgi:hypothetical protein
MDYTPPLVSDGFAVEESVMRSRGHTSLGLHQNSHDPVHPHQARHHLSEVQAEVLDVELWWTPQVRVLTSEYRLIDRVLYL